VSGGSTAASGLLLVLGSKPEPALPPVERVAAVVCANASGHSARRLGLPDPLLTVMTAVIASGKASDEHSLLAVRGLRTRTLYFLPRPKTERLGGAAWLVAIAKQWRMQPWWLRRRLAALDYHFERFEVRPAGWYHRLVVRLCGDDPEINRLIAGKQPSTGTIALALALEQPGFAQVVVSGFDYRLTHAYGTNPLVAERGDALSKHADTDVAIMAALARREPRLVTTERVVHERAGVPLFAPA
jgi:hypothetical protein